MPLFGAASDDLAAALGERRRAGHGAAGGGRFAEVPEDAGGPKDLQPTSDGLD